MVRGTTRQKGAAVSPRSGGEADKFGNRYEGAWTVHHLLRILAGRADSITVEDFDDLADGVEFTFRHDAVVEVHQVKRQHGVASSWTPKSLQREGVWGAARRHAGAGREYHFVSATPAQVVSDLCELARRSRTVEEFRDRQVHNETLRTAFTLIAGLPDLGSEQIALDTLRRMRFRTIGELEIDRQNDVLAGLLLEGATGVLTAAGLGDLVVNNLGTELTQSTILAGLAPYGLRQSPLTRTASLAARVEGVTTSWLELVASGLLEPVIQRSETAELGRLATNGATRVMFLAGAAGGGKSAVLHQAVTGWRTDGAVVLAFRLDRLPDFSTTEDLGGCLDLPVSPVAALAAAAGERPALLVLDQLDAVSFISGRSPRNFDVIADLTREAAAFPGMRVVLACRGFDIDNDDRIRRLASLPDTETVSVGPLADEQVDAAVEAMGVAATSLTAAQRSLLRVPLHLVLLSTSVHQPDALRFQTGQQLLHAYWERKRQDVAVRRREVRFASVVFAVADQMSRLQRLSVPATVFDRDDLANDADVLVSEHVLVRDGQQVAFFHEAFFDYAFARQWVAKGDSLVGFLTAGEQELFRRAQVRQIMTHLREVDPARFVSELRDLLLSDDIRFHIKAAAIAVLGAVGDPTGAECDMLLGVAASRPQYRDRVLRQLRFPGWFDRLDVDGHITRWLSAGGDDAGRASRLLGDAAAYRPRRVAELLRQHHIGPIEPGIALSVLRQADPEESRAVFELFLDAVRSGSYDDAPRAIWLSVYGLPAKRPDWAVEVLKAFLVERPEALTLTNDRRVADLVGNRDDAGDYAERVAAGAPEEFCAAILPYMLQVMALTAVDQDGDGLRRDRQFSRRYFGTETRLGLGDALMAGMAAAVRALSAADPVAFRPTLETLADNTHDGAQWLLYEGLRAAGPEHAEWAALILLQGRQRLLCGYAGDPVWTTRQLLQAITPHVTDATFARLEAAVRDFTFPWETREGLGWHAFELLSGMDTTRLSEIGRRRLGELKRRFGREDPAEPEGSRGGTLGSPIPGDAAARMSDDDWLRAIAKYAEDRHDWERFVGGARELSYVLKDQASKAPDRFARFALRLGPRAHPAYADAILTGLGEAERDAVDDELAYMAIRHLTSFARPELDRPLSWAMQRFAKTAPLGIVELVRDRLLATTDPSDDGIRVRTTDSSGNDVAEIETSGLNTDRGALAEAMASLLHYDIDGSRTALVEPYFDLLATDPAIPVRTSVARLLGAAMRHAGPTATGAFWKLLETDDVVLAVHRVVQVLVFLGNHDPAPVLPVLDRMLASQDRRVREVGGQLAAFAALEWEVDDRLERVLAGDDGPARKGVADIAAEELSRTARADLAERVLTVLADDDDQQVRDKAAGVAASLRGSELRPYAGVVRMLIRSEAFTDAAPQLLITLNAAPDRVDDLALLFARRFVEVLGADAADLRTGAAADTHEVTGLLIRGLAQTRSPKERSDLLDVLDGLLLTGAYGIDDVVNSSER